MEASLLTAHGKCKSESSEMAKEPKMKGAARVQQVQFYQSCVSPSMQTTFLIFN